MVLHISTTMHKYMRLKHPWNFGQITDPNLTLGNPLSFSSWTATASSKKSTVKFVAHSLFN